MKHIFISYSPKDTRILAEMRKHLINAGFKPWIDPAPRPGADWRFAIDDAIRASDALIVIITPASAESVYVTYEWTLALALGVPVIPVIFKQANMHPRLITLEHFNATDFKEPLLFWDYFIRELRRFRPPDNPDAKATQVPPPPPAPAASAAPDYSRTVMPTESGHWLVIRRGPDLNKMHQLMGDVVSLGRDPSNNITIDDPEVSRYHLRFLWRDGLYAVEDLGSTNGTVVNDKRIAQETRLASGSAIRLGESIILSYEIV